MHYNKNFPIKFKKKKDPKVKLVERKERRQALSHTEYTRSGFYFSFLQKEKWK